MLIGLRRIIDLNNKSTHSMQKFHILSKDVDVDYYFIDFII